MYERVKKFVWGKIENHQRLTRVEFIWHDYDEHELPAKLADSDYTIINFPLEEFAGVMLNTIPERSLFPWPHLRFKTIQAIVPTTAGRTFYATITKDLQKELTKRAAANWRPK